MDQSWDQQLHHPSIHATCRGWDRPLTHSFESSASFVRDLTTTIAQTSYEPTLWLLRAQLILALGYPELAAGDAYKARLLSEAAIRSPESPLGTEVRLELGFALWLRYHGRLFADLLDGNAEIHIPGYRSTGVHAALGSTLKNHSRAANAILLVSLQHANDFQSTLSLALMPASTTGFTSNSSEPGGSTHIAQLRGIIQAKRKACQKAYAGSSGEIEAAVRNGSVAARRYPWMSGRFLQRAKPVVKAMEHDVKNLTKGGCEVRDSKVFSGEFGVFASKRFRKGDVICVEAPGVIVGGTRTRCAACCAYVDDKDANMLKCCGINLCRRGCGENDVAVFHRGNCKSLDDNSFTAILNATVGENDDEADGDAITDRSQRTTHTNVLIHRQYLALAALVLANGSQSSRTHHPLTSVPPIARLVANYTSNAPRPFRFSTHIASPIAFLTRQCSVDVFADARFDTWVLHTIRLRIENNEARGCAPAEKTEGRGNVYLQGMWNTHSAMNHSCDPNVEWIDCLPSEKGQRGRVGLKLCRALRHIEAGEELGHAYADVQEIIDCRERAEVLAPWVGDKGCGCLRCRRERAFG